MTETVGPPRMRLAPSSMRRVVATSALFGLGVMLLLVGFSGSQMALGWKLFVMLFGVAALWGAIKLWVSTSTYLELTETAVVDGHGQVLAELSDIAEVQRGAFAFKPSNGFVLVMKTRAPRAWAPGLYWRLGRRLGIGGVTPAGSGKAMADVIAARISGLGRLD